MLFLENLEQCRDRKCSVHVDAEYRLSFLSSRNFLVIFLLMHMWQMLAIIHRFIIRCSHLI